MSVGGHGRGAPGALALAALVSALVFLVATFVLGAILGGVVNGFTDSPDPVVVALYVAILLGAATGGAACARTVTRAGRASTGTTVAAAVAGPLLLTALLAGVRPSGSAGALLASLLVTAGGAALGATRLVRRGRVSG